MSEDETKVSSLELMRRLAGLLPDGSFEQTQVKGSIAGLSTPEFFGNIPPAGDSHHIERARTVLKAILPRISEILPSSPIVAELLRRYPA